MPFRPPPPGLNDSYSGSKPWTPPTETKLSADDEATAEQYRKMLKMGMPDGAVSQKMQMYGVGQHIIDAVFPPDEPETEVKQSITTDSDEDAAALFATAGNEPAKLAAEEANDDAEGISPEEEEMTEKYRKMMKMGMPEAAVIQKMSVDGVPKHVKDAVLAAPSDGKADLDEKTAEQLANKAQLTAEEEEMVAKYKKMFNMGMPEGAVSQKMSVDEVPEHVQDAVLAPKSQDEESVEGKQEASEPKEVVLSEEEENLKTKYKKMIKMGMPDGAVVQKMNVDEIPQRIQDAVLAPEPNDETKEESKEEATKEEPKEEQKEELEENPKEESKGGTAMAPGVPPSSPDPVADITKEGRENASAEDQDFKVSEIREAGGGSAVADGLEKSGDTVYEEEEYFSDEEMDDEVVDDEEVIEEELVDEEDMVQGEEGTGRSKEIKEDTTEKLTTPTAPQKPEQSEKPLETIDFGMTKVEKPTSSKAEPRPEPSAKPTTEGEPNAESEPFQTTRNRDALRIDEERDFPQQRHQPMPPQPDGAQLATQKDAADMERNSGNIETFEDEIPGDSDSESEEDQYADPADEEVGTRTYQTTQQGSRDTQGETPTRRGIPTSRRRKSRRKHPDRTFHRLVFFIYVLMIGGGVAVCLYFLVFDDDNNDTPTPNGAPTTALAPINTESCDFSNIAMPHVIDQCRCNGDISIVAADVEDRYQRHLEEFVPRVYQDFDETMESCSVRNQALVWLATANDFRFSADTRSERFALANLFIAAGGSTWTETDSWLSESSACSWYGISCTDGKINSIALSLNNLVGSIPNELLLLQRLSLLSLSQNRLDGEIPQEVFFIPRLTGLFLNGNELRGEVPLALQQATLLAEVDLSSNTLDGTIPEDIDRAVNLADLNLAENSLRGSVPSSIFTLTDLTRLQLQSNQLEGSIPSSISGAALLRELNLSANFILGSVPSALGSVTNLERLVLRDLDLGGTLPQSLFARLSNMFELVISETGITGAFPSSIARMSNLEIINMSTNRLRDVIPSQLGDLDQLQSLDLSENSLSGTIPTSLGDLSRLAELRLNDNSLTGGIPSTLGRLSDLETLTLDDNIIQGTVPSRVCDLRDVNLDELVVDCAAIECEIPACCTICKE